ncbi:MAG: PA2778 family cysteine peptidase [Gammaproteobacteria bacterium]|nr:PA2778 family cysteine peptidase [Gammaproteobacteria bacterium]
MKALSLIIGLLLLSSCASTPQSRQIQTNGPGSLSPAIELTDTPFYPQTQYQCGPAALATVLQSHGVETTPEKLSSQVYIPERKGSLQIEMIAAARRNEMLPYKLESRLIDLFAEIDAGNPVLVLQNLGFDWYPNWHYAVVIGYDTVNHEVILRSGTTRRWITPFEVFERTWQRADFWALVIVPVGKIPDTAQPLHYLKTVYAFEETRKPELAFKAYQAASRRWPDVAVTWLALGNMAFANHKLSEAVKAFDIATRIEPESITSWNNLAYALHAYGCGSQAQMALQCGLKIAPDDSNLLDSKRDLIDTLVDIDQIECPVIQCNQGTSD